MVSFRTREIGLVAGSTAIDVHGAPISVLSYLQIQNPVDTILKSHPGFNPLGVYFVPVKSDAVTVWWGRMPHGGQLSTLSWLHSHAKIFQKALLFAGRPDQVGLLHSRG